MTLWAQDWLKLPKKGAKCPLLLRQRRETQKRHKITLLRPTSYKPIGSAKWLSPFNNSEIWIHPGIWSVSQTLIWTNQWGLYFWFGSCMDRTKEENPPKKKKKKVPQRQRTEHWENLGLMKKLPWNQEINRDKFTQVIMFWRPLT